MITGLQGLKNLLGENVNLMYAKGCNVRDKNFPQSDVMYFELSDKEKEEIDEAVEVAKKAEVAIIYVGDDFRTIGESRSRVNLDLSGRQKELVRAVLCRENAGGKIPRISLKIYSFSAGLSRKTAIFPEKKIRRSRRLFLV